MNRSITRLVLGIIVSLAAASASRAVNDVWDGKGGVPPNGNWENGLNWSGDNTTPGMSDTATFSLAQTYTVTFAAHPTAIQNLTVSAGAVTFASSSGSRTLNINSGGGQDLLVTGGMLTLGTGNFGNPVSLTIGDDLVVNAAGTLIINDSSRVNTLDLLLAQTAGNGTVEVNRNGELNVTNDIAMALNGNTAILTYSDTSEGTLSGSVSLAASANPASAATLNIDSSADVMTGSLFVGTGTAAATGTINITGGGAALTQSGASTITVGTAAAGIGNINIGLNGTDGALFDTGTGLFTINATGTVTVGSSGILDANGDMTINGGVLTREDGGEFLLAPGKTMTIQNGGRASFFGNESLSNNIYNVTGATSTLETLSGGGLDIRHDAEVNVTAGGSISSASSMDIGAIGNGTLVVAGNGSSVVANSPGTTANLWGRSGNTATITFSGNATGTFTGVDLAGDSTAGTTADVDILSGAQLSVGRLTMATAGGATTTATLDVQGSGSTVTHTGQPGGTLIFGHSSSGTAVINIGTTGSGASFNITLPTGTLTINATGTVNIGSGANTGTLNANVDIVVDGGTLTRGDGSTFALAPNRDFTALNNANVSFIGTYPITGGSTYTFQSGADFSTTATTFGNGTLIVNGLGSQLAVSAATQIGSGGLTGSLTVRNGATADFNGVLGLADASTSHFSGGILHVQSGATITTANIRIAPNSTNGQTGTFTVGNGVGTTRVTQDANATLVVGGNLTTGPVPNSGTLNINSGGVFDSGTGTGNITINRTGTVSVASGGTLNANGNVTIDDGALTSASGSTFSLAAGRMMTIQNTGTASFSGSYDTATNAIYNITGSGSRLEAVASGTLNIINGATVNVSAGGSLFAATTIQIGFFNGTDGTLIVDGPGTSATTPGAGAAIWGFGGATANVTFRNDASGSFSQVSLAHSTTAGTTAIVKIESGAHLTTNHLFLAALGDATTSATLSVQGSGHSGPTTVGQGTGGSTLTVGHPSSGTAAINIGTTDSGAEFHAGWGVTTINKTGTLTIGSTTTYGTFYAAGNVNIDGGLLQVHAGSSAILFGTVTLSNAGTLQGSGSVIADGDVVNSSGVVGPGTSAGELRIIGNYSQSADGKLLIELASPSNFDRLVVFGDTSLAGTLDIDLLGGYSPAAGSTFNILDWGTLAGTFDTLDLPALSAGLMWNASQLYITGALSVTLSGDFNLDGTVDAADYIVWRKGVGVAPTQANYDIWRANFGQPGNGSGASVNTTVPEPATALLITLAVAGVSTRRRWCACPVSKLIGA